MRRDFDRGWWAGALSVIAAAVFGWALAMCHNADDAHADTILVGKRVTCGDPCVIEWTPATGPVDAYEVQTSTEPMVWRAIRYAPNAHVALTGKLAKQYREGMVRMRVRAVNRTARGPYSALSAWMRLEARDGE